MIFCAACGTENTDGTQFCVKCGAPLASANAPGSWRSGEEPAKPSSGVTDPAGGSAPNTSTGSYTPGSYTSPGSHPSYSQPQSPMPYQQSSGQQMHPAIPAIVSFFLPGIGLLFVPNKAGLGLGIFGGYLALNVVLFILAVITFGLGTCLFFLVPLVNVAAGIHSWDEAAKASNGQFQPLLFK